MNDNSKDNNNSIKRIWGLKEVLLVTGEARKIKYQNVS